ncbi:hypothetical protein FKM82_015542 [Ascaphus truei]
MDLRDHRGFPQRMGRRRFPPAGSVLIFLPGHLPPARSIPQGEAPCKPPRTGGCRCNHTGKDWGGEEGVQVYEKGGGRVIWKHGGTGSLCLQEEEVAGCLSFSNGVSGVVIN